MQYVSSLRVGVRGLAAQRNFAVRNLCPKTRAKTLVFWMDDDVRDILEMKVNGKAKSLAPGGLWAFLKKGADVAEASGAFLWGLSTTQLPQALRRNSISRKPGLVSGFAYGQILRRGDVPSLQHAAAMLSVSLWALEKYN